MEQLFWKCWSKTEIFISLSHFTLSKKHQKLTDHERQILCLNEIMDRKSCKLDTSLSFKNLLLKTIRIFQTQVWRWGRECTTQSTSKQVVPSERANQASLSGHDGRLLYPSRRSYIFAVWVKCVVVLFARQLVPRKCRLSKVDDYRNSSTIKWG